jgi:hypothetical protein
MKVHILIACASKNIFTSKSSDPDKKKTYTVVQRKWKANKGIYIEYLADKVIEAKRIVKKILKVSF